MLSTGASTVLLQPIARNLGQRRIGRLQVRSISRLVGPPQEQVCVADVDAALQRFVQNAPLLAAASSSTMITALRRPLCSLDSATWLGIVPPQPLAQACIADCVDIFILRMAASPAPSSRPHQNAR